MKIFWKVIVAVIAFSLLGIMIVLGTDFFDKKEDVDYIAKSVDYKSITENDYNLSVSSYIEVKDTRPKTDIKELNERIRRIVERENELRIEIDKIVAELEEDEL